MYGLTIQNVRPLKKIISEFLMSAYIKMFYDTSLLPMNTYPTVGYVFIAITDKIDTLYDRVVYCGGTPLPSTHSTNVISRITMRSYHQQKVKKTE